MFAVKTFMTVNKRLTISSEDQAKTKRRPDVHRWHALWHALGDIAGKTGPIICLNWVILPIRKTPAKTVLKRHEA